MNARIFLVYYNHTQHNIVHVKLVLFFLDLLKILPAGPMSIQPISRQSFYFITPKNT